MGISLQDLQSLCIATSSEDWFVLFEKCKDLYSVPSPHWNLTIKEHFSLNLILLTTEAL